MNTFSTPTLLHLDASPRGARLGAGTPASSAALAEAQTAIAQFARAA